MPIIARKPGGQRITGGMKTEENVVSLLLLWYKARRHSVYFARLPENLTNSTVITHTNRHVRRGAPKLNADRESEAWDSWRHNPNLLFTEV